MQTVKKIDAVDKKFVTLLRHNLHSFLKFGSVLFFFNHVCTFVSGQQALGSNGVSWSVVASQPYTVSEAQGEVVNGKLYSFGGFDSQKSTFTPTKRAYVYDPAANLWSPIADLPYTPKGTNYGGVTHAGITTDGTNIFMAGGYTSNSAGTGQIFGTPQVWRYNVAQDNYTALTPLPEPLSAGQLEYLDGRLHYMGGTNAARTEDLGAHYVLDLNNTAAGWVSMAPLPNPRHHGGSAVLNGRIYFIGGQHEHDAELAAQKDVHSYDPVTDTWTQVADLPVPSGASGRGHISSSVAVLDGRIIVLGGETVHASQQTNMVSAYSPTTDTWENLTPLPFSRFSGVAGLLQNSLIYTGGSKTSTAFKGVPITSGTSNTNIVAPLADAFVRNGTYAGTNYGSDTSLLIKTNNSTAGLTRFYYLKFALGSASDIVSAKLRLYGRNTDNAATNATIIHMSAYGLENDSWTEADLTFKNAPIATSAALSSVGVTNQALYYELDVTDFVKHQFSIDKIVSFLVKDSINQNQLLTFNSKENAANPPQLVISTTTPSGTLTFLSDQLDFSVAQYGTTANQATTISANAGSPAISLTKPSNSNWLILPSSPAIGSLSFGINASGLIPGTYTTTVTAAASGYSDATLRVNLVVSETMVDTITLTPLADAFVRNGTHAVYNFGSDTSLQVKTNNANAEFTRSTYLKFSLTDISNVVSAKLRLNGRNTENTTAINMLSYGVANDSWTEGGITWNNAPDILPVPLSAVKVNNQEKYYELDVTDFIKNQTAGDKIASLVIKDTANQNRLLAFKSREYGVNQPELVVITTAPTEMPDGALLFTQSSQSAEIEQGGSQSLLEYISTSDTTPVTAQLNAIDDNGSIPEWLSVNGKLLNGTAYTTGSEISFDFDATSLSIGKYSARITASAPGYSNAVLEVFLTVKAGASGPLANLKVNFQDSVTLTPTGWLRDFGQAYGPRTSANQGTGNVYGWIKKSDNTPLDLTKNGRKRTSPSDVLLATLIHMQGNHIPNFTGTAIEGVWEAQVGNGNYDVTVSVGDGSQVDSKHFINIEGVPAIINFAPTTSVRFKTATISVSVSDGFLTVDAAGGTNTKINWITVQPTTSKRPSVVRLNPESSSQNVSENTSVSTSILNLPNGGVDNTTITSNSVYLTEEATGTIVPSTVNGTGGGDAITLVPMAPLKLGTTYVITITDSVKDLSGASFIPYSSTFTTGLFSTGDLVNAKFERVSIPNAKGRHSSLTVGPDGKLYALSIDGVIKRFVINADGTLGDPEFLYSLQDASGTRQQRLAVGLAFDPSATADNLIVWITHSSFVFLNAPDWDGKLTRLSGPNLENVQDVLINLPRSAKDHLSNSIAFGPDGVLYFTQGSNSAMGRADKTWNNREENLLSAAVLKLDVTKLGNLPIDVKTAEGGGTYNPYAANAPLTIYASGVRNAYDLVWHSNGQLYVPTNGSAAGGNTPVSIAGTLRTDSTTYSGPAIPALTNVQQTQKDFLFRVQNGGYYGHPNALRGEYVMNGGNPTSSIDPAQVDSYPLGTLPDNNWRGYAFDFQTNKSPNGAIEYKSNTFDGVLKGKLMVVRYSQNNDIITLTPGGNNNDIISYSEGTAIEGFTGFVDPLDLTEDVRNGNIYVSEYGGEGSIILLRPRIAAPSGIMTVTPDKVYENDVIGGDAGWARTITVKNTGTGPLAVSNVALTGTDVNQFILGGLPTFPATINAQDSLSFTVAFNPATAGLKTALVTISGNDSSSPTVSVPLRALGTTGTGGTNEPSLQALFDLVEIPVFVGDDNATTTVINSNTTLQGAASLGEEISIQKFVKADTGKVTIEPLAVFGPTASNPVLGLGWYKSGDTTTKQQLFSVSNNPVSNGQTVNVNHTGTLSFDPGTDAFGFYSNWPYFNNRHLYSEDHLNTFAGSIPHHVRVYPYKNKTGVVPNTYIVAVEEHTSGFDYQDVVFIVRNVHAASSVNVIVTPLGDAYVRGGTYAGTNYGTDTSLAVKTNNSSPGYTRNSYLKFLLTGVVDIVSAKLRIYGRNPDNATLATVSVFGVQDDTWGEMNVTFNNAPAAMPGAIGSLSANNEAKYHEVDVTDYIKAQFANDKTASLLIKDSANRNALLAFNSKEHPLYKPQLVLVTSSLATMSNSLLYVENLDKFPSNDRFVASRIQIPWTRDNTAPYVYNANHDTVRVRIHNKGINPLIVSNLILSNKTNWKFLKLKGIVYDSATAFPLNISSGTFADLTLQFIAPDQSTRVKLLQNILTIISNDDKTPAKDLLLAGLWQYKGEGSREPRAQEMINTFGFKTNTGFTASDPDDGDPKKPKGDQVVSSYFLRANPDIPITVTQMGAYHGCCRSTERIQWFSKGTSTFTTIVTHIALDGQTLLPRKGTPAIPAENTFNPTTAFGLRIGSNDHTDTLRNPGRKIGIRAWKAIDGNGRIIPNSYIVSNDYLGSDATNYDYNDNMYLIQNIKPENGTVSYSELTTTPSAVDFDEKLLSSTNSFTLNLKSLGQVYSNGSSDPALVISAVVIRGENSSEFTASMPFKTTLNPQDTTNITIGFNPISEGLKIADLLIYYNNSLSPHRVPLYGISKASGTTVKVHYRINSGSATAKVINGKSWSADQYAFDNLEPYTNPKVTAIAATDEDALYLDEQSSNADKRPFRYELPVENGNYVVRLHFAEIYWGTPGAGISKGAGARVMSVNLENQLRLVNLDLVQEVGAASALIKNIPVTVTDGKLNIDFSATVNRPMISAIEVYSFDAGAVLTKAESIRPPDGNNNPEFISLTEANERINVFEKPMVYPNPLHNKFNIKFPAIYKGHMTLQITDVSGRVYEIGKTRLRAGGSNMEVNLSRLGLKPGVYLLKFVYAERQTEVVKLLIE
jgi:N-acetylneuraminic acid mutarotase